MAMMNRRLLVHRFAVRVLLWSLVVVTCLMTSSVRADGTLEDEQTRFDHDGLYQFLAIEDMSMVHTRTVPPPPVRTPYNTYGLMSRSRSNAFVYRGSFQACLIQIGDLSTEIVDIKFTASCR